eukprot:50333-Rhodomonas_salina.2
MASPFPSVSIAAAFPPLTVIRFAAGSRRAAMTRKSVKQTNEVGAERLHSAVIQSNHANHADSAATKNAPAAATTAAAKRASKAEE